MENTDAVFGDINQLPEDCISLVISLTSPRDACVSSAVSRSFRPAADSDATWVRFLPSDYASILSRAVDPVEYASKKELYFRLCDHPLLIDGGNMSFALEKLSGAKCYMISARAMKIVRGDDSRYGEWITLPGLRFEECAMLKHERWLEMHGKVDRKILTPHTTYGAYLIFKLVDKEFVERLRRISRGYLAGGLHKRLQQTCITISEYVVSLAFVCLDPGDKETHEIGKNVKVPRERRDEWMEIEMGEFYSGDGIDGEVDISLKGVKGGCSKGGLIVQGIEVRPKL